MAEQAKAAAPKATEKKVEAAPAADATSAAEEMKKFKPKKKVALPAEMLTDAKSYDDKLVLVKMLTEKERNRMILIVKNMLKGPPAVKK